MRSRHVSVVIRRDPTEVYRYARDPQHLPAWASGLAGSAVRSTMDGLVADSPMGEVTIRFAPSNDLGVLDHEVRLQTGAVVYNPMRVLPHPQGAEVVFTLRQLALTDAQFDHDESLVRADLGRLATVVEAAIPAGEC